MLVLVLLFHSTQPMLADEKELVSSLFPGFKVKNVRIDSGWSLVCLYSFADEEDPFSGMALCQKVDDEWIVCVKGGGVLDPGFLSDCGVPLSTVKKFFPLVKETQLRQFLSKSGKPLWTFTQTMHVEEADLQNLTPWELTIMRAEIFARHGRTFEEPYLKAYFSSRPWYKSDILYSLEDLSSVEKDNAEFIADFQATKGLLFRRVY